MTNYTETDPQFNAWNKDYNDLINKPTIPTVPANVSAFTNDAGYITSTDIPEIPAVPTNVSAFNNDAGYITMDSVPAIPTAVSAFTNDAGYLTSYTETDPNVPAWAKEATKPAYDYSEIANTPEIPVVPTNVSTFTNDAGYLTAQDIPEIPTIPTNVSAFTNDAGYITDYMESDPTIYSWAKAAVKPTYSYSEILNTPTLFDGNYNSLSNKPNLATVATTGNYNDLSNKPSIPAAANNATLTIMRNGYSVGTFTANASSNKSIDISVPTTTSELINNSGFITNAALPTNVSQLNNDAGYITAAQCSDVNFCYLADLVNALQQQVADLQAQLDSMGLIVDTAITHMGFHCGISTVTDYDGNIYNTVQIGEQCWMKENLRTTHYPNGAEIPLGSTPSNTESFRYNPNNDANTVNTYGYLYNWSAVMHGATSSNSNPSGVQGLCPAGWHVPSDAEWTQLTNYVSCQSEYVCGTNSSFIAKALAATIGWTTDTTYCAVGNDPTTNNATGFTAIPAGYCWGYYGGLTYQQYGSHAFYSSSTQSNSSRAYGRFLKYDLADVVVDYNDNKFCGLSVRCVLGEGTAAEIPTVTTSAVTNITENTATCSGEVIADGNTNVTSRGVCWSTSPNPTVSDNHTTDGGGMGSFTSSLTGLEVGILYYVRAYATNSAGTAYGEEIKISIPSVNETMPCSSNPTVIDYDGNVYNTVQIGAQCWMKENLRTTHYPNGAEVSELHCPNNDASNVNTYGYLYRWDAMMHGASSTSDNPSDVQGVCPAGWHVPSDAEWMQLTDYLRGQSVYVCGSDNNNIAKSLAASTDWNTDTSDCTVGNNLTANNATGFGALPAGYTLLSYSYNFGNNARYWSSTFKSENHAFYCNFSSDNSNVERPFISIGWAAFSVRCLRD